MCKVAGANPTFHPAPAEMKISQFHFHIRPEEDGKERGLDAAPSGSDLAQTLTSLTLPTCQLV